MPALRVSLLVHLQRKAAIHINVQGIAIRHAQQAPRLESRPAGKLQCLSLGDPMGLYLMPASTHIKGWCCLGEVSDLTSLCDWIIHVGWQWRVP